MKTHSRREGPGTKKTREASALREFIVGQATIKRPFLITNADGDADDGSVRCRDQHQVPSHRPTADHGDDGYGDDALLRAAQS